MTRKPVMLAQTILRRILLTGGSGVLPTTAPADAGGVFAAGGGRGFTGAAVADGSPAFTVSPGCGVVALLAGKPWVAGLSTETNPQSNKFSKIHFNAAAETKLYNSP